MKNLKRMSFTNVSREFLEIEKHTQSIYIGKTKYTWQNGTFVEDTNYQPTNQDFIFVGNKQFSEPLVSGVGAKLINPDTLYSKDLTKKLFEFMCKYTNVEWGMTVQKDGTATLYTDNKSGDVNCKMNAQTAQLIHSHSDNSEISDIDKERAGTIPQVTHTHYRGNGVYKEFNNQGYINSY